MKRHAIPAMYAAIAALCATTAVAAPPVLDRGLLPGDHGVLPAINSQQDHAISKGADDVLVVWSDYRGMSSGSQTNQSDGDVYGIRLNSAGQPLDPAPFLIAGGMGLQNAPRVAWNGSNWLVVYQSQDPVAGFYDTRIRYVRVSPEGEVLDAVPPALPLTQFSPSTIGLNVGATDGQWLITGCFYHSDGYGTYLAGSRIGPDGALLDTTPRMLIDWVYGPSRILSANGEYLVAGPDWNTSTTIKARRIATTGLGVGSAFNIPSLDIASSGTDFYVSWISGFVNRVGSPMSPTGTLLNPAGTLLFSIPGIEYYTVNLAHDGTNWWFDWTGGSAVRTMRIAPDGTVLDPGGVPVPIVIGGTVDQAYNVTLTGRTGGGVLVSWHDLRPAMGYDTNVYAIPLSPDNEPGAEVCISTGTRSQRSSAIAPGPDATMAVAFLSEAANDVRVLWHPLDAQGNPATSEPVEVYRGPTIGRVGLAWNGSMYMVVWDQGASGLTPTQVRARRLSADGTFIDAEPIDVMAGFNPDVGALGDDFLVVAARYGATGQIINLWGRRYDGPGGAALDGAPIMLAGGYVSGLARVRSDATNWRVTSHAMWSHDSSQGDAILVTVPTAGAPSPANNPTPISGGTGDLDIAFSGSKYLLVWRNNTLASANNFIAGRIMNADGTFPPGSFTIAEAPGRQLRPTVSWDGTSFVVAWDDQRNRQSFFDARTDVYAARVSEAGAILDTPAFAVVSRPDADCSPAIFSRDGVTFVSTTRLVLDEQFDSYRVGLSVVGDLPCAAPVITSEPTSVTACGRGSGAFSVGVDGSAPQQFQWEAESPPLGGKWVPLADGAGSEFGDVTGAATASLSLSAFGPAAATAYRCVVTNACGSATSAAAVLSVCWADFSCDGIVNSTDVSDFINAWFEDLALGTLVTDFDRNGVVNSTDVSDFINRWFEETAAGCGV